MGMIAYGPERGVQTDDRTGGEKYRLSFDPGTFRNRHDQSVAGMAAILSEIESQEDIDPPKVYDLIDSDGLECLIAHHYECSDLTGELAIERDTEECHVRVRCSPESVSITIDPRGTDC